MAVPIRFQPLPPDPRAELHARLEAAPEEHAEALLEVYEILQSLHDRGIFKALKGLLGAGDFVLENVVETAKTPEAIRTVRNALLLSKMLGMIEPELLEHAITSVTEGWALGSVKATQPPGFLTLFQKFSNKESRRGLAAAAEILETFGKRLGSESTERKEG